MNTKIENLIRKWDDPILKQVCAPVVAGESLAFVETMIRVCKKAPGCGLAAPQIGVAKRVIYTHCASVKGGPIYGRTFINPQILLSSVETDSFEEGCLSYPGVLKSICRPIWIQMKWISISDFTERSGRFDGFIARVIQHEVDHLDGICKVGDASYIDDAVMAQTTWGETSIWGETPGGGN